MIKKISTAWVFLLVSAGVHAQAQVPFQAPQCTRAQLQAATDSYVAAQTTGDISGMTLADDVKFFENMAAVDKAGGLWNKALPVALSRSIHDTTRCKTFSEVIITEGEHQYVIGTRLYFDAGKVTRVDSLVTDQGDWLFNANAYLKYSSAEDWSAPPAAQRTTGMPDSHTFRLVGGTLRQVHTLSVNLNPNAPSPQADDNGAIIR